MTRPAAASAFLTRPIRRWTGRVLLSLGLLAARGHAQHAPATPDFEAVDGEARRFQLATGLRLTTWAAEPQLANPVAFSLTPSPRPRTNPKSQPVTAWVAETHRYGISVLDITQNTPWLLNDLSLRTVSDRVALLSQRFATNLTLLSQDSERIRRVADTDGDLRADRSEVVAEGFNTPADGTAAGILAAEGQVWFANIPNLWLLEPAFLRPSTETEPTEPAQPPVPSTPVSAGIQLSRRSLASGFGVHIGVTGHDLHGLVMGPDGFLYASFGDRGLQVTNREGRLLQAPDTGGVVRCEPDGRNLELFCTGLRNPQDLVFDHQGNLFTSDNDTAGADDCRVLHLMEGVDYGWRTSYQHMRDFGPWVREQLWKGGKDGIPAPAGRVAQGPAGLAFHPGGKALGGRYRDRFLHCDFPGGVWAFELQPEGASFRVGRQEQVLWNCWPTDVEFGPDGALYVLDWVAGWGITNRGRIHRITPDDAGDYDPASREVFEMLRDGLSRQPQTRQLALLGHEDYRIRLAAGDELVRAGSVLLGDLISLAGQSRDATVRRHALWVMDRILRGGGPSTPGLDAALDLVLRLLVHPDAETRLQATRVLGHHARAADTPSLLARTQDPDSSVRTAALAAAARQGLPLPAAVWARDMSPWEELALSPAEPPSSVPSNHAVLLHLRRRASPALAGFFAQDAPELVLEAARAIHDLPVPEAFPALASLLGDGRLAGPLPPAPADPSAPQPRSDREQLLLRVLNAQFRLGEPRHASNLVDFALGRSADGTPIPWAASLRAEALFLLAHWEVAPAEPGRVPVFPVADPNHGAVPTINPENWPGWFDRVTGLWRPLAPRSTDAARNALEPWIKLLVVDPAPSVALAAVEAVGALGLAGADATLVARLSDAASPPALRHRIPSMLAALGSDLLPVALQVALQDRDPDVQAAAIPWLGKLQGDQGVATLAAKLREVLAGPSSSPAMRRLGQAAIDALGDLPHPLADEALADALRRLFAGSMDAGFELNLLEAARKHPTPPIQALLSHRESSLSTQDPLAPWTEVLVGGDAERGRRLFLEKAETQCARCHRVDTEEGGAGGTVGPALDGLGSRQDRRQILSSILTPNRQIAPGFESVLITLRDGRDLSGIVRAEDANRLFLAGTEEGEIRIEKSTILRRARGLSAMPEGLGNLLSRRELRDIVEFLASLRNPSR